MSMQGPQPVLKTSEDHMPRAKLPKRTGLIKVRIGTQHLIKERRKGQKGESIEVRDVGQHPDAKVVVRCLTCKKDFKSEKDLVSGHPSAADMKEDGETHVWGFWSEDKAPEGDAGFPILGLLSDESIAD